MGYLTGMAKVMIVEDHADTNDLLSRALRAHGHETVPAFTGEAALAVIGMEKPDAIILDMMMPGMDGIEVLRLIRQNPGTAMIPVIFYSIVADRHFTDHALAKGANDYWVKGTIDLTQINDLLAPHLSPRAA